MLIETACPISPNERMNIILYILCPECPRVWVSIFYIGIMSCAYPVREAFWAGVGIKIFLPQLLKLPAPLLFSK